MTITRQQVDAWDAEVNAAYERGRQEGMKQERALWTLTKLGQEIEAQPAQEPVAWMFLDDLKSIETTDAYADAYSIEMVIPYQSETVWLYTAPPLAQPAQESLTGGDGLSKELDARLALASEAYMCRHLLSGKGKPPVQEPTLQEQEPVAWGVFEGNLHDMFFSRKEAEYMAYLKGSPAEVRPLYTTPPAAQLAQEPVAWSTDIEFDDDTEIVPPEEKGRLGTAGMTIPLYTAPQQRPWVGLTDEGIQDCYKAAYKVVQGRRLEVTFARAIEAKLKEKNT